MSIVNSFSASTTISSTDVNANFTDIGTEITGSLARDGQSSMTAQLKAFSGTVGTPGYGFASDTDTGFYRIGGDNVGLSLGGTKYFDFATTGLTITGALDVTGALTLGTALAVAEGGTGATTASAAATALGLGTGDSPQFTGINVGHASDTTITRASSGDIAIEGNIVYRAGGTDIPVEDGGTGTNTAAGARTNLGVAYASEANMEAAAASVVVTPDVQHHHPGHTKAWVNYDNTGTAAIVADYGVSSVSDDTTGTFTITVDTAFSAATYGFVTGVEQTAGAGLSSMTKADGGTYSTTQIQFIVQREAVGVADTDFQSVALFGAV